VNPGSRDVTRRVADVADEAPGDPVVDADGLVLTTAVTDPALQDSPQADPAGQVEEDHGVDGRAPDRQGGGVVAVDDPPGRGDQVALQGREGFLIQRLPVLVVVQASRWTGVLPRRPASTRARRDLPLPPQPTIAIRSIGTDASVPGYGRQLPTSMLRSRLTAS
jgi:hypothetical protein